VGIWVRAAIENFDGRSPRSQRRGLPVSTVGYGPMGRFWSNIGGRIRVVEGGD
jgi:hypothetical protein